MTNALRESLARHAHAVEPPALDVHALVSVGEKRLRRRRFGAVAGSVLAVTLAVGAPAVVWDLRDEPASVEKPRPRDRAADRGSPTLGRSDAASPGPDPSPIVTYPALSAEQIRQHPDATLSSDDDFPSTASGVAARIWSVCLGECTRATEPQQGERQTALEVSRDDFATGALYVLDRSGNVSHAVDDWYFIGVHDGPILVDSRGHRRLLQSGASVPVTDIAGPLVYSSGGVAYIDISAKKLHVIDGEGDWDWQGAADTWFWGTVWLVEDTTVTRQAAVWRRPDGTFAAKVLPIGDSGGSSGMLRAGTPGTMAVVEHFAEPRRAHISTDYGATWQIREVPAGVDSGGALPADWTTWPPG